MYPNSFRPSALVIVLGFIFFGTLLIPGRAQACPLGAGETRLEISRVMRNFGRLLSSADQVARDGASRPQEVTDQQLTTAIEGIRLAQSCAQAAIDEKTEAMLPIKAKQMQGAERERYLQKYYAYMVAFATALESYKSLFEAALRTEKDHRDFTMFNIKRTEVTDRANKAHADL